MQKEITIDGIEYICFPKNQIGIAKQNTVKNDNLYLDLQKKYKTGNYIALITRNKLLDWTITDDPAWFPNYEYKLVHKKHEKILSEFLEDQDIEIERDECDYADFGDTPEWVKVHNFIDRYNENDVYRLKLTEYTKNLKEY